jgi:serine/threonine protein phosphatase 1
MLEHGLDPTLAAYGIEAEQGLAACREGALAVTRWTSRIRSAINTAPGHANLLTALRRAAYTSGGELLFVHAGIDPTRPLTEQGDAFWWGGPGFLALAEPYGGYRKVIRGFDRRHAGFQAGPYAVSLDRGCGFGGTLACACFAPTGEILDSFEA